MNVGATANPSNDLIIRTLLWQSLHQEPTIFSGFVPQTAFSAKAQSARSVPAVQYLFAVIGVHPMEPVLSGDFLWLNSRIAVPRQIKIVTCSIRTHRPDHLWKKVQYCMGFSFMIVLAGNFPGPGPSLGHTSAFKRLNPPNTSPRAGKQQKALNKTGLERWIREFFGQRAQNACIGFKFIGEIEDSSPHKQKLAIPFRYLGMLQKNTYPCA